METHCDWNEGKNIQSPIWWEMKESCSRISGWKCPMNFSREYFHWGINMKILVCGGREFRNIKLVNDTLDKTLTWETPPTFIIHGGARGADTLAHIWAMSKGIQTCECLPNWNKYNKMAGPRRNALMLLLEPDVVIAFPGGSGTWNMVNRALDKGFKVLQIQE